ncbi:disease resistance protein L6-like isoform X2 [Cornus florida]|uniref:disease resistance protein L6-like isoform X2 n=1 Tax=Cornus florida TaxID=4283 RepID=UPI00289E779B|nr:disease resistance protein L6-like isoform X2 [Cornus florida]
MEQKRKRPIESQMESESGTRKRRTVPVKNRGADADTATHSSSTSLPGGEADADTALDSSSTSLPGGEYQVFLSFSGSDTRYSFADFLYTSLIDKGVRTFRDVDELRQGEKIGPDLLKAITESSISIPIFSKKYACSKWCLMELTQMVECKRSMRQKILPVFYDVTPEEVKHQPAGSTYEQAIKKHKESGNFSDETIEQWKKALKDVGQLKGWELEKAANGYQGKLIRDKIIPEVLSVLCTKVMVVTKNLIGIDHHEKEMMRLLDIAFDDVRIVGIHGMTGIGKTTVAKFIYNKVLENFECCSFLLDVQKMAQEIQGLVSLQKQLLADTLNWRRDIANVDRGIAIIKKKFCNKKVLLVLDDVNSISQFHCLVGGCDWRDCFRKGSKIIVTTKNKSILDDLDVNWTYEIPTMNAVQSLRLFSKHAFGTEFPPKNYVSISREIASVAGGLPLTLEYAGLSLRKTNVSEIWEDAPKKLAETLNDDVWKKLRVDYKALNKRQQQIFLDIACLFAGMDKTTVFYMWNNGGYFPKTEFDDLHDMSLVKVRNANELWMHNQLRALGKKIVNEVIFPENRSRLWNHVEAFELLEDGKGTAKVEALSLRFALDSEKKHCFKSDKFTKLKNLRYLRVDGADLRGNFSRVLLSLRWLSWRGCPRDLKELKFHMRNLVILDLSDSGITEKLGVWNQIQTAKKLKVLGMADCALTRTPNFSSDAALEILILARCTSLENIDPSIGNLKNLKVLDISYADIRELPDEIWELKNLEVMDFTECSKLDVDIPSNINGLSSLRFLSFYGSKIRSLPASISGLTHLQTLNIGGCTELQLQPELPSSLSILNVGYIPNLTSVVNLQEVQFFECDSVVDMPRDIGRLSKLEKLTLDHTNIRSLPEDVGVLSQLKVLDLRFCDNLQCILGLPSSLVELYIASCDSLERLPDLSNLINLSSVLLMNCDELARVQGIGKLESLTSLYIYACNMLATSENMPNLSNLKKLETLSICNCSELDKIQGFDRLESLKYLDLRDCENLHKIEGLESLKYLEVLDVLRCASEMTIPEMPYTRVRQNIADEMNAADSVQRYWTELRLKKLNYMQQPVLRTGYRNEAAR